MTLNIMTNQRLCNTLYPLIQNLITRVISTFYFKYFNFIYFKAFY